MSWGRTREFPAVVEDRRPTAPPDRLALDVEVAAINQMVTAMETLPDADSVKRVLDYVRARFERSYQFHDGGSDA